jgi:hypothetical protein
VLYQINDQRCFAAVFSTDDVNAFQDNSFPWGVIPNGAS